MNVRPATEVDFPAMTALIATDESQLSGRPSRLTVGDLGEWLAHADLERDTWLIELDGVLCALGWCHRGPVGDAAFAAGIVHPDAKSRGLGVDLIRRSETRAAEQGASRLHQFALGSDAAAAKLLTAQGYDEVRRFYEMAIELDGPPETLDVPIETLAEDEARAFHAAIDEAFQDHWEHHSIPFEIWWSRHKDRSDLDLSLWFLIRDGDELAAVSRNEANRNGGGYVAAIGVRRPWRGKGTQRRCCSTRSGSSGSEGSRG